jgi:hypothetical protein
MIISFDPKTMHVQIVCGISEKFEPNQTHEVIRDKVEELKKAMEKFRDEVLNPGLSEVTALVDEENKRFSIQAQK